jgi:hypothetical protein
MQPGDILNTIELRCPHCERVLLRSFWSRSEFAIPQHNLPATMVVDVSRETKESTK